MILVDSTIWNAAKSKRDRTHESARKTLGKIMGGAYGKPAITDYIMDGVLTWLNARATHKLAVETADFFFTSDLMEVIKVDWAVLREALELFKKHDFLSFTDATTATVAKIKGIKDIATFDEDFSKLGFNVVGGEHT